MRLFVFTLFAATALLLLWQHGLCASAMIAGFVAVVALFFNKLPKFSSGNSDDGGLSAPGTPARTGPVLPGVDVSASKS